MWEYFYALIISQFIATNTFIISEIFAFIMKIMRIKCFTKSVYNRSILTDNIKKNFYTSEVGDLPCGILVGKWYIGRSKEDGRRYRIVTIFCTQTQWDNLNGKIDNNRFSFEMSTYSETQGLREIQCKKLEPRPSQQIVLDAIQALYNEQNYCTTLITGSPGTGKTKTAVLLAQSYSSIIFRTNIELGIDNIEDAYNSVAPSLNHPMIVLFDEFDETVDKMFKNKVIEKTKKGLEEDFKVSNEVTTAIFDKRAWNALFDAINDGMFPYTIFILASNISKEEIDKLNNSLLRAGRINMYIKMEKDSVQIIHEKDFVIDSINSHHDINKNKKKKNKKKKQL